MKAFGHRRGFHLKSGSRPGDVDPEPIDLSEVSFAAQDPEELRAVARFLFHAADALEECGGAFGHEHLRDWLEGWSEDGVDLIVARVPDDDENEPSQV